MRYSVYVQQKTDSQISNLYSILEIVGRHVLGFLAKETGAGIGVL